MGEQGEKFTTLKRVIKQGGLLVMKTDTLYGILADAFNREAVERIYSIKKRNKAKPFIVLIGKREDLDHFAVREDENIGAVLNEYWPGPVSIILPLSERGREEFSYLHRGSEKIAFRLPADRELRNFLLQVGPVVAPSANPEREKPASTIQEARQYFDDEIDYYHDGGSVTNVQPSRIIDFDRNGRISFLR